MSFSHAANRLFSYYALIILLWGCCFFPTEKNNEESSGKYMFNVGISLVSVLLVNGLNNFMVFLLTSFSIRIHILVYISWGGERPWAPSKVYFSFLTSPRMRSGVGELGMIHCTMGTETLS